MTLKSKVTAMLNAYGKKMLTIGRSGRAKATDKAAAQLKLQTLLGPILDDYEALQQRVKMAEAIVKQVDDVLIANRIVAHNGNYRTALEELIDWKWPDRSTANAQAIGLERRTAIGIASNEQPPESSLMICEACRDGNHSCCIGGDCTCLRVEQEQIERCLRAGYNSTLLYPRHPHADYQGGGVGPYGRC